MAEAGTGVEGGEEGKRVGVAIDFSDNSKKALKWTLHNLLRPGDYVILLFVRPDASYEAGEMQLWKTTGTRKYQYNYIILCI